MAVYTRRLDTIKWTEQHLYGSSRLGIWEPNQRLTPSVDTTKKWQIREGQKRYELTNHLGNVLVTVNDRRKGTDTNADTFFDVYDGVEITATDYFPFGLEMPGRTFQTTAYRFGFNGKENDRTSWSGTQLVQDYGMRLYNPAIGKFLSVDPLFQTYPWNSTYAFSENNPINYIDLDGAETPLTPAASTPVSTTSKLLPATKDVTKELARKAVQEVAKDSRQVVFNTVERTAQRSMLSRGLSWLVSRPFLIVGFMLGAVEAHAPNPMNYERLGDPNDWTEQQLRDAKNDLDKGKGSANQKLNQTKIRQAAQLKQNKDVSKESEKLVETELRKELEEGEVLLIKPRIYFGDNKTQKYAVPDFAVWNVDSKTIVKIYDAKNGEADFTDPQIKLHNEGGKFYGTSRTNEPTATQKQIGAEGTPVAPGLLKGRRTDIKPK